MLRHNARRRVPRRAGGTNVSTFFLRQDNPLYLLKVRSTIRSILSIVISSAVRVVELGDAWPLVPATAQALSILSPLSQCTDSGRAKGLVIWRGPRLAVHRGLSRLTIGRRIEEAARRQ